jgi:chromosome segregation ATPase
MFEYLKRKITNWLEIDRDRLHLTHLKTKVDLVESDHIELQKQLNNIMSALDNLNTAVGSLTKAVDAALVEIQTPHPSEGEVQLAADLVNEQVARLQAALAPDTSSKA